MKRFNELDCFAELENNILENLNLLKIAKCYCEANFDEDDYARYMQNKPSHCPYFQPDDEYKIVRKQN